MGLIPVDRVEAGMVLQAAVVDLRGRLLIPAGKELSERHVAALPMWGVKHIEIQGPDPAVEAQPDVDPEALSSAESAVAAHFVNADGGHPFLIELRRVCVQRMAIEIARQQESE